MNAASGVHVHYPSPGFMCSAISWYDYPLRGFRELGIPAHIDPALDLQSRSALGFQVTAFDVYVKDRRRRVCFDWCDFDSHHVNLMRQSQGADLLYFKVMTRPEMQRLGIRPIGQTVSRMAYLDLLPALRDCVGVEPKRRDVLAVFRTTCYDLRTRAVEIIRAGGWNSLAHVSDYPRRPPADPAIVGPLLPFKDHLYEQARTAVNIALPGVGGDWTWRHVELMGMGACMITVEPEYVLPGLPERPYIECNRDLSDLGDMIDALLTHPAYRREVAAAGRRYYEAELSPAAMARRMIEAVRESL